MTLSHSMLGYATDPTTILVALVVAMATWFIFFKRKINYPPGPTVWPIIGTLPYVRAANKPLYSMMMDLRAEYGDVVRLRMGPSLNLVLILGKEKVYKATVEMNEVFKFRPRNFFIFQKVFGEKGVLLGNGDQHAALRKFTLLSLRDLGVGKKSLEEKIQLEATMLCSAMEAHNGEPRLYFDNYRMAVSNIIVAIVFGERFEYEDQELLDLVHDIEFIFKELSPFMIENYVPITRFLPGSKFPKLMNVFSRLKSHASRRIQEHRLTFDPDNIRDFVDLYIKHEEDDNKYLTEENIFKTIIQLHVAGTDTTATAMRWALLYLVHYPDTQRKCREEINKVVGSGRMVSLSDKPNMPYLQAFISELLRISAIAPQTVPHTVIEDTEFDGYTIPKDSIVIFHLYSILMDPDVWKDPEVFRPERFLTAKGELAPPNDNMVPFGLGGRSCIGKHLARMEIFMFLATMIQRFEFQSPPGAPKPTIEKVQTGVTSRPHEYKICAVPIQ